MRTEKSITQGYFMERKQSHVIVTGFNFLAETIVNQAKTTTFLCRQIINQACYINIHWIQDQDSGDFL